MFYFQRKEAKLNQAKLNEGNIFFNFRICYIILDAITKLKKIYNFL